MAKYKHDPYMFSITKAPEKEKVKKLEDSMPDYTFDPAYGAMVEKVKEPYWKSGKQHPPTEIIQLAMNRWFVENADGTGDGYVVKRKYIPTQDRIRWTCTCQDFLIRRQGSEHPWCKHIYHVYTAFESRSPEHAWVRFAFIEQAVDYIEKVLEKKPELTDVFMEDLDEHMQEALGQKIAYNFATVFPPVHHIFDMSKLKKTPTMTIHTTAHTTPTTTWLGSSANTKPIE